MDTNTHPTWMDDALVQNIPHKKLEFLSQLYNNGKGKNQKEMMAYVLPMMKKAKAENLTFTQAEMSACIQAIQKYSTDEERSQIDALLKKRAEQQ